MILGIGGKLSGGKTNFAVKVCAEKVQEGKRIISNIPLFLPNTRYVRSADIIEELREHYEDSEYLKEFFKDSILLLDEIVNLLQARGSGSVALNQIITNFIVLTGKIDCDVIYTFQVEESQVDKILRDICNIYAECYRIGENGKPIVFATRKVKEKIRILVLMEMDFGLLGKQTMQFTYDPEPYYNLYDTTDFNLLDRTRYLRGGSRDLRR